MRFWMMFPPHPLPPWNAGQTGHGPRKQTGRRSSATGCFGSGLGSGGLGNGFGTWWRRKEKKPRFCDVCAWPRDPVLGAWMEGKLLEAVLEWDAPECDEAAPELEL